MLWIYLLLAVLAGMTLPAQAGVNAELARWMQHPVLAALVSFIVGTLALFIYSVALRLPVPAIETLAQAPRWSWFGGLLGAFFVAVAALVLPKLGATLMVSIFVAGQMLISLVFDRFGVLGSPVRPLSAWRICGVLLLLAGVALIRKF